MTLPYKDFAVVDLFKTVDKLANPAAIESCTQPNQKPPPGGRYFVRQRAHKHCGRISKSVYTAIRKDFLPCYAEMLDLINFELCILNFE